MQEEELDSCRELPASEGREKRMRVQGETGTGSPCRFFTDREMRSGETPPLEGSTAAQAAFFAALVAGCGAFFFAVNSCRTLVEMASVSTL